MIFYVINSIMLTLSLLAARIAVRHRRAAEQARHAAFAARGRALAFSPDPAPGHHTPAPARYARWTDE